MKLSLTYHIGLLLRYGQAVGLCVMLALLSSCGNLYTGEDSIFEPDPEDPGTQIPDSRTPVMVAFSDPAYNVLTKGVGVIDPEDKAHFNERMSQGTYFIYSFRRDNPDGMNFNIRRAEDTFSRYCLVDGSLDEATPEELQKLNLTEEQLHQHGKRASYAGNGSFVNWRSTADIPYYSNKQELDPFSFFAYYYDDAKIGPVIRDNAGIRFDVEVDGSQDLMCAQSIALSDVIDDIENNRPVDPSFYEMAERLKALDPADLKTMKTYYYNTFTARFNIWPIIQMQHQLAYVKLKFFPAFTNSKDIICIKNVTLNTVNKGVFTVVSYNPQLLGANFAAYDQRGDLHPLNTEGKPVEWITPEGNYSYTLRLTEEELSLPIFSRPSIESGCFLVPPSNDATITIETVYYRDGDLSQPMDFTITTELKDKVVNKDNIGNFLGYGFMKSREYNIRASVYGPQEIEINVEPSSWVDGGDIEVDPENDPKSREKDKA